MKRLIFLLVPLLVLGCSDPNPPNGPTPRPDTGNHQTEPDAFEPDVVEPPEVDATIEALFTRPSPGQRDTTLEDLFIGLLEDTPAGAEVR